MLISLRGPVLLLATLVTGLMAGVFGVYAHAIMRGLRRVSDRTFVEAFQAMDRAIINPLFIPTFLGALVLTGAAGLLYLQDDGTPVVPWAVAAFVLYLAVFIITIAIHVPLNDQIKAAGNPDQIADLAEVRLNFQEASWRAWNIVRALATTMAFVCLLWALVLHGRLDDSDSSVDVGRQTSVLSEAAPPLQQA